MPLEKLRPTVKRDLSLFSLQGWQKGYTAFLKQSLGWWFDIILYYDGNRVNFYHKLTDFNYFKEVITEKLLEDNDLFTQLNREFQDNIKRLQMLKNQISSANIEEVFFLIGKIMSLYIFIVSDDFIKARPEAWRSRNISEGILYQVDELFESWLKQKLEEVGQDVSLSHYLTFEEVEEIINNSQVDFELVNARQKGYILYNNDLLTAITFKDFCQKHNLYNPEDDNLKDSVKEVMGEVAYKGSVKGVVKIVNNTDEIAKVNQGDILVTIMTNVNYLPALKRAAAIVTDEGGITCHAAIVARELKKPCLTGTKIATKVLKDGDEIEVDATKGLVKIIRK